MTTFSKTMFAAAAVLGTTSLAAAGFRDGGSGYGHRTAAGHYPSTAAYADGHSDHGHCADGACATGDCVDGSCGHGHCADGQCGVVGAHTHDYLASRPYPSTASTRPVATYGSTSNYSTTAPYYTGQRPAANCPGGVCPTPQRSTTLPAYRPVAPTTYRPAAANCANGNCQPTYAPQPQYRAAGYNLFGLRF